MRVSSDNEHASAKYDAPSAKSAPAGLKPGRGRPPRRSVALPDSWPTIPRGRPGEARRVTRTVTEHTLIHFCMLALWCGLTTDDHKVNRTRLGQIVPSAKSAPAGLRGGRVQKCAFSRKLEVCRRAYGTRPETRRSRTTQLLATVRWGVSSGSGFYRRLCRRFEPPSCAYLHTTLL